ncbi:MAG: peptidoglycan DD-metalloendopeptidase family protein [Polyangiaceae bacterium]
MSRAPRGPRRIGAMILSGVLSLVGGGLALGVPAPSRSHGPVDGELEVMLKQYDADEKTLESDLEAIQLDLKATEARIIGRGRSYYKAVRHGLLPAGNGFEELMDHAATVERNRLAIVRDVDHAAELRKREKEINARLDAIKANRVPMEAHRRAMAEAKSQLQQADERRDAFGRAFQSSNAPSYVAIYGADKGPQPDAPVEAFAKLRGHLPFPVAGRAQARKVPQTTTQNVAVDLLAPDGSVARSVAPARVAFADHYQDEHFTIILDHGDRYFTVYGNLEAVQVKVGDTIPASTPLGRIATTPVDGTVLYFEIREKGQAVDPGPWLGLD